MGLSEDTVKGKIISVEHAAFNKPGQMIIGMPGEATLITIQSEDNKIYRGYILGRANIYSGIKVICTIKKIWNANYVFHNSMTTSLEAPTMGFSTGNTVYRKIEQYQVID